MSKPEIRYAKRARDWIVDDGVRLVGCEGLGNAPGDDPEEGADDDADDDPVEDADADAADDIVDEVGAFGELGSVRETSLKPVTPMERIRSKIPPCCSRNDRPATGASQRARDPSARAAARDRSSASKPAVADSGCAADEVGAQAAGWAEPFAPPGEATAPVA